MDRIRLTGLRAFGHHGVFDHERTDGQEFLVDLEVPGDLSTAGRGDALADTVDYGVLAEEAVAVITGEPFDLIESVAEGIARRCLAHCAQITVTVHKPQAPIPHAFADVSVTVTRSRGASSAGSRPAGTGEAQAGTESGGDAARQRPARAVLALGANLGEPLTALRTAVAALERHPHITVTAASHVYRTAPVGGVEQPDFLNAAVLVDTALTPLELLGVAQGIEVAAHRTRDVRWGPRTLDIDLIRYAAPGAELDDPAQQMRLALPRLDLPHPRAAERAFVLAPWEEIAPGARVEVAGAAVGLAEAIARAADAGGVERTADTLGPAVPEPPTSPAPQPAPGSEEAR
ncbi:2-amino-4-hydroxy-6-hydroxymethyldihydropteridine diphosphokinase [Brevibacterium sp. NPDC049920]|uniref:2-amino-4-hydroxy-6- hydroxymethyldihydropteridine diphosphokinase n=1 Tax=Brevibacterium sp. NPDC049920 TaxID=3155279 RepID=UPI00340E0619